ncbi:MAG: glycosyltransferase, partial [Bacteroidota bacterium]|nr:glycosyltransferase [Bacteroidota bacterium]MEC8739279.1 glycosyltransferase [Bacteroidota bacterium]
KPLKKKLFLHLFRLFGFPKKIHFHATDKTEYENIQLKLKTKQISLVENIPIQTRHSFVSNKKLENELTLVFVSRISKKKNLHFLLKILKTRSFHGDIKLDIYGPKENDYWNVCRQHLDDLPENIKIAYKGVLEHRDVLPNIRKYHFFVLPTLGENFGHAIFESFVSGRPVIISDQTPWRNLLKGKIGWDLSLKNEEIWADTINRALSMGQHEFNDWCKSAYSFASRYQKKNTLAQYKNLFS